MNSQEKQIVNEAVAIIAKECNRQKDCGGCPLLVKKLGCCWFKYGGAPKDLEPPFKTKTVRQWLSGKQTEVIDNGG